MKKELKTTHSDLAKMDDELLLMYSWKFEIIQSLDCIVEIEDAPYVDYMSQLQDAKLQLIISNLSKFSDVSSSGATSQ